MQANPVAQTVWDKLMTWPLLVALNLLVALTGYLKDVTIAAYLGTSPMGDAFTTTYFIVDLVGVLALGNAVGLASAAIFGPIVNQNPHTFACLVRKMAGTVILSSLAVVVVLFLLRPLVLFPFVSNGDLTSSAPLLYEVFLPTVVFYPLFYFFSGVLQAKGRYILSVGAPSILNIGVTLTGFLLILHHTPLQQGSIWLALSISVGSVVLMLFVLVGVMQRLPSQEVLSPSLAAKEVAATTNTPSFHPEIRLITAGFFSIVLSYGIYLLLLQGLGLIERYVVSLSMHSGSLAAMTYATRLGQIPNWVFMSAVSTWVIPHLARAKESGHYTEFARMVNQGLRLGLVVGVPMAILFLILRVPLVSTLFQHGQFDASSTRITAAFLAGYALAMTFQALSAFLFRVTVTASPKMAKPILHTAVGVGVSAVSILVLTPRIGAVAIGLSEAIGSLVTSYLLWRTLYNYTPGKIFFSENKGVRYILSNIAVIGMSMVVKALYTHVILPEPSILRLMFLAVCVALISAIYTGLLFQRELHDLLAKKKKSPVSIEDIESAQEP